MNLKQLLISTSLLIITACSDNNDSKFSVDFTSNVKNTDPEVIASLDDNTSSVEGVIVKSDVRTFSVSWSVDKGYSSALYLSPNSSDIKPNTDEKNSDQYISLYTLGINQSVSLECQVDVTYTVIECIKSGQTFGQAEVIMSHILQPYDEGTYAMLTVLQSNQEVDLEAETYSPGSSYSVPIFFF